MKDNWVEIYDTTLRDGAQGEGLAYSVEDKIKIARALDEIGVAFIEGVHEVMHRCHHNGLFRCRERSCCQDGHGECDHNLLHTCFLFLSWIVWTSNV